MRNGFVRIAAAVPEIRVADTNYNLTQILSSMEKAAHSKADILLLPYLCITGATCGDLIYSSMLQNAAQDALNGVIKASAGMDTLVFASLPMTYEGKVYPCCAAISRGKLLAVMPLNDSSVRGTIRFGGEAVPFGALTLSCENLPGLTVSLNRDALINIVPYAQAESASSAAVREHIYSALSMDGIGAIVAAGAGWGESTTDGVYTGHCLIAENGQLLASQETLTGAVVSDVDAELLINLRRRAGRTTPEADAVYFTLANNSEPLIRRVSAEPFIPTGCSRSEFFEKIMRLQAMGLMRRMEHTGAKRAVVGVSGGLDSTLALLSAAGALDMMKLPRENLIAVTMPCFGTTQRTKSNAVILSEALGATLKTVDIGPAVTQHFADIGHNPEIKNAVFENSQARERTQVLMDIANGCGGLVIGTGDMSEMAMGWCTYNGDHMSMYSLNGGIPKSVIRGVVGHMADKCGQENLSKVLTDILDTPVSPELLPTENENSDQKTEDIIGPYELHDFFLWYSVRCGFAPAKVVLLAENAFKGVYDRETIKKWLTLFLRRFFSQQFKRSCVPDGPAVLDMSLSPRGGFAMPSDALSTLWLKELETL